MEDTTSAMTGMTLSDSNSTTQAPTDSSSSPTKQSLELPASSSSPSIAVNTTDYVDIETATDPTHSTSSVKYAAPVANSVYGTMIVMPVTEKLKVLFGESLRDCNKEFGLT
eukprot:Awhi_evm1s6073